MSQPQQDPNSNSKTHETTPKPTTRKVYIKAIGPRLRILLWAIFLLSAALVANSSYLASVTFLEWVNYPTLYQNYFYQIMFLGHLFLGVAFILPYLIFGLIHMKNANSRPNRRAVRVGYALFIMGIIVLVSGIALTRVDLFSWKNIGLTNPTSRQWAYWAHVLAPLVCIWLYILHRLAGPRIQWKYGVRFGAGVAVLALGLASFHSFKPRPSQLGSEEGRRYFLPSLARTDTGNFIPARTLMMDQYCQDCHSDTYDNWFHSSHHFSSFNNPFYLFSIQETREVSLKRDGDVRASRWCAGCHDPVPFFSGQFDDPNYDIKNHPTSQAGITCTSCHAITAVNSNRGNADYTISEPVHYPFVNSTNSFLQYLNRQMIKAKPEFHKRMFLKPFMKSEEFCSTCHKVSLPGELTQYKEWLRGQNHYDAFILSGAGHGARSFYFPPKAAENCATCHMPLQRSEDFGAMEKPDGESGERFVHNHLFPSANTALPFLRGDLDIVAEHEKFSGESVRVDIFGLRKGAEIDGPLTAPLDPEIPALDPGNTYLLEVVLRTLTIGHLFSQGTVDSNEIWVEIKVEADGQLIGSNGSLGEFNEVDRDAHFVNVYMLDRNGNRIDRRNAQDIFTPLYNHQIPPGAGYTLHYKLNLPDTVKSPVTVTAALNYRKFDTIYYNYVFGKNYEKDQPFQVSNDLPIRVISQDQVRFPVASSDSSIQSPLVGVDSSESDAIPEWIRWNDYGIGLMIKGSSGAGKGELLEAEKAFQKVEELGRVDGPMNLARLYLKEGRIEEARQALARVPNFEEPPPNWLLAWLTGEVNRQLGQFETAIENYKSILEDWYPELEERNFDFSRDYMVINALGSTLHEWGKQFRLDPEKQQAVYQQAVDVFNRTLEIDNENLTAHYQLSLLHELLGNKDQSNQHRILHAKYKPDENARDQVITIARQKDPAADRASQSVVIYPLK